MRSLHERILERVECDLGLPFDRDQQVLCGLEREVGADDQRDVIPAEDQGGRYSTVIVVSLTSTPLSTTTFFIAICAAHSTAPSIAIETVSNSFTLPLADASASPILRQSWARPDKSACTTAIH